MVHVKANLQTHRKVNLTPWPRRYDTGVMTWPLYPKILPGWRIAPPFSVLRHYVKRHIWCLLVLQKSPLATQIHWPTQTKNQSLLMSYPSLDTDSLATGWNVLVLDKNHRDYLCRVYRLKCWTLLLWCLNARKRNLLGEIMFHLMFWSHMKAYWYNGNITYLLPTYHNKVWATHIL